MENIVRRNLVMNFSSQWFCQLFVLTWIISTLSAENQECKSVNSSSVKLSLQNKRNATGHRNLKVFIQSNAGPAGTAEFAGVEAEQTVSVCGGVHVISTTAVVSAPPIVFRQPGYELVPGLGYYKYHTRVATWDEAVHICAEEGAILLSLDSEAEANVLKDLMGRKVTIEGATWANWVYAGFHDRGVEGEFMTLDGKPIKGGGYQKWYPQQPDNAPWGTEPGQDCGAISNAGLLQDLPCLGKLPFICKQQL